MNMDRLRANMNKDVTDRNARRAKRRKEITSKGGDPKDVSEDEKDGFDFVLQTVERAVEAELLISPAPKPSAGAALLYRRHTLQPYEMVNSKENEALLERETGKTRRHRRWCDSRRLLKKTLQRPETGLFELGKELTSTGEGEIQQRNKGAVVNIPTTVFCEILEPPMGHMHNQVTEKGKCLDDVMLRKAKTIAAENSARIEPA
ncbi:hypothetical protein EV421DRAFT_1744710 [Armillaria borealis]|uniref:Uncharacterized protein n=1 Tax=Armillaria borealis TaxID=47425 RepID=A0AA39IT43_9AGAR|nr:hypothetical protein EV421DRAFT_1744710 [Armillaria borealis]